MWWWDLNTSRVPRLPSISKSPLADIDVGHRCSLHRTNSRARRLDPAKPGEMSQVSGGEVELVDVGGDRLVESVEVAA